jgi:hypothetical protein
LHLQGELGIAIVPAPLSTTEDRAEPMEVVAVLDPRVRLGLAGFALGLMTVLGVAAWLSPFDEEGRPLRMETHLQLGLPPCTFRLVTGMPCPSCGMTTSFALLMHGALADSLRANAVGTLLAVGCVLLIPWSLACAYKGRRYGIVSIEKTVLILVIVFVTLALLRWLVVLALGWQSGTTGP